GLGAAFFVFRHVGAPAPSSTAPAGPRGTIAFVRLHPGSLFGDLFTIDAAGGSGPRRVTSSGVGSVQTALSPDGTRIVFAGGSDIAASWNIYVLDVRTGTVEQLTHSDGRAVPRSPDYAVNEEPSWTPDGHIRFFRNTATKGVPGPAQGLWEMNADGS